MSAEPCEVVLVGCGAPSRGMGWYHAEQLLKGLCPSAKLCYIVEPWFLSPATALEDLGPPLINNKLMISKEPPAKGKRPGVDPPTGHESLQEESMQDHHRTMEDSSKGPETNRNDTINDFIIVLHDDVTFNVKREQLESLIASYGSNGTKITHEYQTVLKGFAVSQVSLELLTNIEGLMGADIESIELVSCCRFPHFDSITDALTFEH
jgi:hypothetical protein